MGWLQRIFSGLRSDSGSEMVEVLPVAEIISWLQTQRQHCITRFELERHASVYLKKLASRRWFVECKLDEWEKNVAGFSDPIREEVAEMFRVLRYALDQIPERQESPVSTVIMFHRGFGKSIEELFKLLKKSDFEHSFTPIMTEDDKREQQGTLVNPFYKELLELNDRWLVFEQQIIRSGLKKMDSIEKRARVLIDKEGQLRELAETVMERQERLRLLGRKKIEKETELQELQKEEEYQEYVQHQRMKESVQSQMVQLEQEIVNFFTPILPLFAKLPLGEETRRFLQRYSDDVVMAFRDDEFLQITHCIDHVKALHGSGKLEEISFEATELLEKDIAVVLKDLQRRLNVLSQEKGRVRVSSVKSDFAQKVEEVQYRVDHFTRQHDSLEEAFGEVDEKKQELEDTYTNKVLEFQNLVSVGLGKQIRVTSR